MTDWSLALQVEHRVAQIITQQEINGVQFDKERAIEYVRFLDQKQMELYEEVRPQLDWDRDPKNRCMRPFSPEGSYSKKVEKLLGGRDLPICGAFTYIEPNLGSREKIIDQLLKHGWQPEEFTETGQPKLTNKGKPVDTLLNIAGGVGGLIAKWYILNHRKSVIIGWLDAIRPDGRITAGANPCGANTNRMQHRTVVNVPKANTDKEGKLIWDIDQQREIFGTQMRSLFIAKPGYVMVGHDASGLENRMLAHYMDDPELTYEIIDGDFHTKVWKTIDEFVHTRNNAKNVEYALFYGAGDPKLGRMADYRPKGWSDARLGKEIRRRIMQGLPALGDLTTKVQRAAKRGYLIGLDGRRLYVRSEHSALNTLLQGAGAITMKYSMCYLDKWVRKEGLDVTKVIDMHDEAQAEVLPEHAELYGKLAVQSITKAGEYLKLKCPLTGEYKIGSNWAETH